MIPTCCYRHAIQLGRHDGGFCAGKLGGTVAATGHRPEFLGGYQHCHSLEAYAQDAIVSCGAEKLICGMALGWDTAVAVACVPEPFRLIICGERVLALWNGQRHGGTFQCVKYAEKKKHPIHHVWDGWMEKLNAA